jgi:ABC-2 type transport system permease protein
MVNSLVSLTMMVGGGLAFGWRWHYGLAAALAAFGLLLLLRFALLWVGIYLGVIASSPQVVTAVQILVWPVGFLSNVFVDPATMPGWLGAIAAWNPLSLTTLATRQFFGNPGLGGTSWLAEHAIVLAIAWPLLLTAVFLPLAARAFRHLRR